ncbi:hypothetical protein BpHYR1_043042 [Brachionus plicatilis]|uniref:Uncharacterized protein n=1 Tax=Brachionus plicatilis TaxID=10195 RepID=A0A3M7PK72_BRAPC|nr:hypothetical protein BpHYR1_043042 [Brachionus plicatilis]
MKQPLFHLLRKSAKYVQILQNCTLFKRIKNKTQLLCTYFADLCKFLYEISQCLLKFYKTLLIN